MPPKLHIRDLLDYEPKKLRKVSNGTIAWLVDEEGNEYFAPRWLLSLWFDAFNVGREDAKRDIRQALGLGEFAEHPQQAAPRQE